VLPAEVISAYLTGRGTVRQPDSSAALPDQETSVGVSELTLRDS
jgi:hypothetical protein